MTKREGGGLVRGLGIAVAVVVTGRESIRRNGVCEAQQVRKGCVMALLVTGQITDRMPERIWLYVVNCRELLRRRWASKVRTHHVTSYDRPLCKTLYLL